MRQARFGTVVAVVRWHGSSWRRAQSAVSTNLLPASWCGRLALLAIALGLVLMHHVVGAHQHSAPDISLPAVSSPVDTAQNASPLAGHDHGGDVAAPHAASGQHGLAPAPPDGVPTTSGAALLHQHQDENGHDHAGSLLHMCLVALVGASVFLLVLVLVALWWRPPPPRLGTQGVIPSMAPRAPPASSRLAELQILRL